MKARSEVGGGEVSRRKGSKIKKNKEVSKRREERAQEVLPS